MAYSTPDPAVTIDGQLRLLALVYKLLCSLLQYVLLHVFHQCMNPAHYLREGGNRNLASFPGVFSSPAKNGLGTRLPLALADEFIYCMRAGQTVDDCTSGFISLDRMQVVLGNNGSVVDFDGVEQAIIPGLNFTCSGSIESWTFGARWEQDTDFIELQIWRPGSEDGSYTKVGSTTINVEKEGQTDLYQYPLSSPLHFQAGDILGYYRQMRLMAEDVGSGHPLYDTRPESAASQFSIHDSQTSYPGYHVLISVTTGIVCILVHAW